MNDGKFDGYVEFRFPVRIVVAPSPELPMSALLLHEAAHIIAYWRWRDLGHERRFNQCERELWRVLTADLMIATLDLDARHGALRHPSLIDWS